VYVLDGHRQPVPIGVTGELYIGGTGVARGYLNRPELTAERFIVDPFSTEPNAQLYKTGDLARWLSDGTLEFLGRNDFQLKMRGFRVEPGEIEARLLEYPSVNQALVIAREDKRLVAYLVSNVPVDTEALRSDLLGSLPDYMVPSALVQLAALPLTPNGKVDRRALPAPEAEAYALCPYEAPTTELEHLIANIWSDLLRVPRVGRHDNFFELGGHSLLVVTVIERMRAHGIQADVRAIFTSPTLAGLAAALEEMEIRL
jgi:acyl-CoA synthetase (AMP-forming)/AMP-acid ligase II/aryl carrier-like protein